jgi:hypothetical protein
MLVRIRREEGVEENVLSKLVTWADEIGCRTPYVSSTIGSPARHAPTQPNRPPPRSEKRAWGRFRVRYMLPESINAAFRSLLHSRRGAELACPPHADMWHTKDDVAQALDLLAVARSSS